MVKLMPSHTGGAVITSLLAPVMGTSASAGPYARRRLSVLNQPFCYPMVGHSLLSKQKLKSFEIWKVSSNIFFILSTVAKRSVLTVRTAITCLTLMSNKNVTDALHGTSGHLATPVPEVSWIQDRMENSFYFRVEPRMSHSHGNFSLL